MRTNYLFIICFGIFLLFGPIFVAYGADTNPSQISQKNEINQKLNANFASDKKEQVNIIGSNKGGFPKYGPAEFEKMVNEINEYTKKYSSDDIILILPFENMLLTPANDYINAQGKEYRKILFKLRTDKKNTDILRYYNELLLTQYQQIEADQKLTKLVSNLMGKNIGVIFLTENISGQFNDIENLEIWTAELLKNIGIDLDKNKFAPLKLILEKYNKISDGSYPTIYKGLLSCSHNKKFNAPQNVLTRLLTRFRHKPSLVIMLHNDENLLKVVQEQMHLVNTHAEFLGFNYKILKNETQPDIQKFKNFWLEFFEKLKSVKRNEDAAIGNIYELYGA